jgi:mannose-6-phosphate isomerase-like protein (cupin superfamily)
VLLPIHPVEVAASLPDLWSPRVIAEVDDHFVKVAKVRGEFPWHAHEGEDEMFFILQGELILEFEIGTVALRAGQMYVVPKGVLHRPVAADECLLMLIERKSTLHTGGVDSPVTRSIEDQLGR